MLSDKHTRTHTQNQLLSSLSENIAPKKKQKKNREKENKNNSLLSVQ